MNIFVFMSDSPVLTILLGYTAGNVAIKIVIGLPNRILRHRNIRLHGYPPSHCDADGDFKEDI